MSGFVMQFVTLHKRRQQDDIAVGVLKLVLQAGMIHSTGLQVSIPGLKDGAA
jgi:hypothetical protein